MRDERLEMSVTFDERRGYIASAPELRQPVTALSHAARRPTRCSAAIPASCTRSGGWPRPRSDESVPARSEHGARVRRAGVVHSGVAVRGSLRRAACLDVRRVISLGGPVGA
jgi:hypothetical protein